MSRVEKKQPEYGSDVVVDLMKALDIEYAAFNPGATFRGIHDSIVNYGGNYKPEVIFCHHEEISVAIAHGYAKAKNKPMIAIVHNMVGLQHASMAIFNAYIDRVPMMVLGGTGPMNTKRRRPRIDWIHTALVQGNQVRDYTKWDDQPYSLADVPDSFIRGYRIATTDPTAPVYINYDADIQEDAIKAMVEMPDVSRHAGPAPAQANPEALRRAAELLVNAQDPLIVADMLGRNPKTVPSLIELAELLAAAGGRQRRAFQFSVGASVGCDRRRTRDSPESRFHSGSRCWRPVWRLDHGEQTNPRKRICHLARRENRQHLDERYVGSLLGRRFPGAAGDRCSDDRRYFGRGAGIDSAVPRTSGQRRQEKIGHRSAPKRIGGKTQEPARQMACRRSGQRLAERYLHGVAGSGDRRSDQARRLGVRQRHFQWLDAPAVGFHQARINPSAAAAAPVWVTARALPSARLWRSKAAASSPWRSNPTATC